MGASQLATLAHHATAAHENVRALRAWVAAARRRASPCLRRSGQAYERAIELWDAVPADDRPTDADAAALFYEGALAAMTSGGTNKPWTSHERPSSGLTQTSTLSDGQPRANAIRASCGARVRWT